MPVATYGGLLIALVFCDVDDTGSCVYVVAKSVKSIPTYMPKIIIIMYIYGETPSRNMFL